MDIEEIPYRECVRRHFYHRCATRCFIKLKPEDYERLKLLLGADYGKFLKSTKQGTDLWELHWKGRRIWAVYDPAMGEFRTCYPPKDKTGRFVRSG